jgi:hypothetical protein
LQRSNDQQNWTEINWQSAATDNALTEYTYLDAPPTKGTYYYRLKITTTTSVYSAVQKVEFKKDLQMIITPNPATTKAEVMIQTSLQEPASIYLFDAAGRIVSTQYLTLVKGINRLPLPVDNLKNGIYWIQVQKDSKRYVEKLVIKN